MPAVSPTAPPLPIGLTPSIQPVEMTPSSTAGPIVPTGLPTETPAPAEAVTATFTPTPTPPAEQSGPTLPPPPTETPTRPPVPTAAPPTLAAPAAGAPAGWLAYAVSVYLDPANVNPSTIACHLHAAHFDGSADLDLTPGSSDCVASPVISPDGQWIAFLSGYGRNMSAGFASHVVVASADGAQTRTFSPTPLSMGGLRWSKDGTQIAYYYYGDFQWHVLDAQSGSAAGTLGSLSADTWLHPNLSPDGQYRAAYCQPDQASAGQHICISRLTDDTRPLGSDFDGRIAWSPDGQWIGYVVQDGLTSGDTSNDGTYLMHPDGTGVTRISTQYAGAFWFGAAP